jgi:hypothetical protein
MIYRTLDANGDYVFGRNKTQFLKDADAVVQAIKTSLLFFKGEWWENINLGVPMFQSILGASGGQKSNIDLVLRKQILGVKGVTDIKSVTSSLVNRAYSFYSVVNTIYGPVVISNIPNGSGSTT